MAVLRSATTRGRKRKCTRASTQPTRRSPRLARSNSTPPQPRKVSKTYNDKFEENVQRYIKYREDNGGITFVREFHDKFLYDWTQRVRKGYKSYTNGTKYKQPALFFNQARLTRLQGINFPFKFNMKILIESLDIL